MSTNNVKENGDRTAVKESTIRKMTRLAKEHNAINLSQGFPNEGPPQLLKLAAAHAILSGQPMLVENFKNDLPIQEQEKIMLKSLSELLLQWLGTATPNSNPPSISNEDTLNQYSPPMGRPDLRSSIADYYQRFYEYVVSPEDITVTLGATEAFASALRTVGRPGDKCVIFQPFHELYPSQCQIFYLEPVFVSLQEEVDDNGGDNCRGWKYDPIELEEAMKDARLLILNSPHNPTGKVFTKDELRHIVQLCQSYDVYLITDEIYEHMCFDHLQQHRHRHYCIPKEFPEMVNRTLVCNSLGKSASATGWRVGWCLHPSHFSDTYRGIHDQLAVMAPHPLQYAALSYFITLPKEYFDSLAVKYQKRVYQLANALFDVGFKGVVPQGAYYLFVEYQSVSCLHGMTSMQAALYLLKDIGVACVPGDIFFGKMSEKTCNRYLRFAACRSDEDLEEAIRRLQKVISDV